MSRSPSEIPVESSWRALLVDLGCDELDVLRRAQLPEDLLSRAQASMTVPEYFRFWEALEASVQAEAFPLKLIGALRAEAFSPPIFAALCSPNLTIATSRISQYKRLVAPVKLHVANTAEGLTLTHRWLDRSVRPPASLTAVELAFFVALGRLATRAPIQPLRVVSPVPLEPAAAYEAFFGVPVEQGEMPQLVFSNADAQRPFLTANEGMWQVFEPELRRRLSELDRAAGFAERVRAALVEALPSGEGTMDGVAKRLATSKRTLQRRLSAEETTFQKVLSDTREALALHYLKRTELSSAEISFLLGFDDPNSFIRAFRSWTGQTPMAIRRGQTLAQERVH